MKKLLGYMLLIVAALAFAYPFIWMMLATFKTEAELAEFSLIPHHPNIQFYRTAFSKIPLWRGLFNSILVSGVVTLGVNLVGALTGYVLSQFRFRGRNLILYTLLFCMMIPFQITLIPLYILMVRLNLTDSYWALILPGLVSTFAILMYKQFFEQTPQALIDAARLDGCSELGILFRILFPMSRPVVITVSIITFMGIWNDVLWPIIVIRDKSMMTMPQLVALLATGGEAQSLGPQLAAAFFLALPIILVYLFFQKYFIQSMAHTGFK